MPEILSISRLGGGAGKLKNPKNEAKTFKNLSTQTEMVAEWTAGDCTPSGQIQSWLCADGPGGSVALPAHQPRHHRHRVRVQPHVPRQTRLCDRAFAFSMCHQREKALAPAPTIPGQGWGETGAILKTRIYPKLNRKMIY